MSPRDDSIAPGPAAEAALSRALRFLLGTQNADGSFAEGDDERFKTWETVHSLLAIRVAGDLRPGAAAERAVAFLRGVERANGSFMHSCRASQMGDPDNYCMETTAVAALALSRCGRPVDRTLQFLLERQLPDGSWDIGIKGIPEPIRRYPSVAAHVLRTLLRLGVRGEPVQRGLRYVAATRASDGLWGALPEAYGTPYYAGYLILTVLRLVGAEREAMFRAAVEQTKRDQNEDGSWGRSLADAPSAALQSAMAVNALLAAPAAADLGAIGRGLRWLLEQQLPSGCWDGGWFGVNEPDKREDVFATNMAVAALLRHRRLAVSSRISPLV